MGGVDKCLLPEYKQLYIWTTLSHSASFTSSTHV